MYLQIKIKEKKIIRFLSSAQPVQTSAVEHEQINSGNIVSKQQVCILSPTS